jgi:hypothetical protein
MIDFKDRDRVLIRVRKELNFMIKTQPLIQLTELIQ